MLQKFGTPQMSSRCLDVYDYGVVPALWYRTTRIWYDRVHSVPDGPAISTHGQSLAEDIEHQWNAP